MTIPDKITAYCQKCAHRIAMIGKPCKYLKLNGKTKTFAGITIVPKGEWYCNRGGGKW